MTRGSAPLGDDADALREVVAASTRLAAETARAEAQHVRVLARAGRLALAQAAEQPERVRAQDMAMRAIAAELGVAIRTSDRTMQRRIGDAMELVDDYPLTLDAWEAGDLTRAHVQAVLRAGAGIPSGERGPFDEEAVIVCRASTPGRAERRLELLAQDVNPETLAARHARAAGERYVAVLPMPDGMSRLTAVLPSVLAAGIDDRLSRQAEALADMRRTPPPGLDGAGAAALAADRRTRDQLRADILADMLLTAAPGADPTRDDDGPGTLGAMRAHVQLTIPALALLTASGDSGSGSAGVPGVAGAAELAGQGPIDVDTARRLAGATRTPWVRVVTHPVTGQVLHTDTYRRTAPLDRYLEARDQHCRFPGCRVPAIRCEKDHTIEWAEGGPTRADNLAHLCQRHHSMKQFTPWRVAQTSDGVLEWTSPLGTLYTERPPIPHGAIAPPGVRFAADRGDPWGVADDPWGVANEPWSVPDDVWSTLDEPWGVPDDPWAALGVNPADRVPSHP